MVDVSDPANPTPLGSYQTAGQALSVDVSGTTAIVANRLSGLEVIDASDPTAPVSIGSYFTEGYAIDVKAVGSYAYVVDRPGGLSVVDLSQSSVSGELDAAGMASSAERPATTAAISRDPNAPGATLAAIVSTDSLVELFDVSNPAAPVAVGTYRHPDRPAAGRTVAAPRVRFDGSLAFIADIYPPFLLQVVDLSGTGPAYARGDVRTVRPAQGRLRVRFAGARRCGEQPRRFRRAGRRDSPARLVAIRHARGPGARLARQERRISGRGGRALKQSPPPQARTAGLGGGRRGAKGSPLAAAGGLGRSPKW